MKKTEVCTKRLFERSRSEVRHRRLPPRSQSTRAERHDRAGSLACPPPFVCSPRVRSKGQLSKLYCSAIVALKHNTQPPDASARILSYLLISHQHLQPYTHDTYHDNHQRLFQETQTTKTTLTIYAQYQNLTRNNFWHPTPY